MKSIFLFSMLVILTNVKGSVTPNLGCTSSETFSEPTTIDIRKLPLTLDNLSYVIDHYNIRHKDIVLAQAIHETGNFQSNVYYQYNNLFGMKHPKIRKTVSIRASYFGYAVYNHWTESVHDYKLWQELSEPGQDYYFYLSARGYAEDGSYNYKLKRIWKLFKLKEYSNTTISP